MAYQEIHVTKRCQVPKHGDFVAIFPNGNKEWISNNERHRPEEQGPAIECTNGLCIWMNNDQIHRLEGPAVTIQDHTLMWYVRGRLHRTQGPAYISKYGGVQYWVDGEKVEESLFPIKVKQYYKRNKMQVL